MSYHGDTAAASRTKPGDSYGIPTSQPSPYKYQYDFYSIPSHEVGSGSAPVLDSGRPLPTVIKTQDPQTTQEEFDPHYQVHQKGEFRPGQVFKTLWPNATADDIATESDFSVSEREIGSGENLEKVFRRVKRFVIVDRRHGHCVCLPIITYSGRSVDKRGVHTEDQTIVYSDEYPAEYSVEYERGSRRIPIKINITNPRHKLDPSSRLNWAELFVVEYDVKVWFIGEVHPGHLRRLKTDFRAANPPLQQPKQPPPPPISPTAYQDLGGVTGTPQSLGPKGVATQPASRIAPSQHDFLRPRSKRLEEDAHRPGDGDVEERNINLLGDVRHAKSHNYLKASIAESIISNSSDPLNTQQPIQNITGLKSEENLTSHISAERADSSMMLKTPPIDSAQDRRPSSGGTQILDTPVTNQQDDGERLLYFLISHADFRLLCEEGMALMKLGKFEKILRRCLLQFSKHLNDESQRQQSISLARVADATRECAFAIAYSMRSAVGQNINQIQQLSVANRADESDYDSDASISDVEVDLEDATDAQSKPELALDASLIATSSFDRLQSNLALYLNPDQYKRAVYDCWPIHLHQDAAFEIEYRIDGKLEDFLAISFPDCQRLGNVMTLTGDAVNAQAQSCGEYMTSQWGAVGEVLLERLEAVLGDRNQNTPSPVDVENSAVRLTRKSLPDLFQDPDTHSQLYLGVLADYTAHTKICAALSWLSSAVRPSPDTNVAYSSTSVWASGIDTASQHIHLQLNPLKPLQETKSCWHALFPRSVIAKDFPIRKRTVGKGLEISFANMVLMGRIARFVEFDDGMILEGMQSLLIPMELLSEYATDDSLQWHYEPKTQSLQPNIGRVSSTLSVDRFSGRYKHLDPQHLMQKRCFLGWADAVFIAMGTKEYRPVITWSGVSPARATRSKKSYTFTAGTSGMGIFGGSLAIQVGRLATPSYGTNAASLKRDVDHSLAFKDSDVITYDSEAGIAWFVPYSCFILFMTRLLVEKRGDTILDGEMTVDLKFTNSVINASSEARKILETSLEFKVRKRLRRLDGQLGKLDDTIGQVMQAVEMHRTDLESAEIEFHALNASAPKVLHGIELLDTLALEPHPRIQEETLSKEQPWIHLANTYAPVFFCKGLGQVIVPVGHHNICNAWQAVPENRNLLVATGATVRRILSRGNRGNIGSRLHEKVEWRYDHDNLVQIHTNNRSGSVSHVQELHCVKDAQLEMDIYENMSAYLNSGFIFDSSRHSCKAKLGPPASTASTTAPIILQRGNGSHLYSHDVNYAWHDSHRGALIEPLPADTSSSRIRTQLAEEVLVDGELSSDDGPINSHSANQSVGPSLTGAIDFIPSSANCHRTVRRRGGVNDFRTGG